MVTKLERTTFEVSRELEYFNERELGLQTGANPEDWPFVILKELVDNALDACENASIPPVLKVNIEGIPDNHGFAKIEVEDNGPGLKPQVVKKVLNFGTRTSDKEAYQSPTRGAQGNALKTVLAIPYVLSRSEPKEGVVEIESCGVRHHITVQLDALRQRPHIAHDTTKIVKTGGCRVTVYTCLPGWERTKFLQILTGYHLYNPHVTIHATINVADIQPSGDIYQLNQAVTYEATNPGFEKWRPNEPTSPLWYESEDLHKLVTAYVANSLDGDRDLTLREFIAQFRGLTSTAKQKQITDQYPGVKRLSDLKNGHGLNTELVDSLWYDLKQAAKPVPPRNLGIIGEDHFKNVLGTDDIRYSRKLGKGELPFVVEAVYQERDDDSISQCIGLNFGTLLGGDPFMMYRLDYGKVTGNGNGIDGLARAMKIHEACGSTLICHVAHPRLRFADRGKSVLMGSHLRDLADNVAAAVGDVLKDHYQRCKTEERTHREIERNERRQQANMREIVFHVLPQAVDRASGEGRFPYSVRQLYYQVQPLIQPHTDKPLSYKYFTPQLVTEYEDLYGPLEGLVYDPRGHLVPPHSDREIPLGTQDVEAYEIPEYEYGKILYLEKEGFRAIFDAAQLGQRYDMALMHCKGFATRAAKKLLHDASSRNITILVAHDADLAGYEIARTVECETRTSKGMHIEIVDIGLKVEDALAMNLQAERTLIDKPPSGELLKRLNEQELAFFLADGYKRYSRNRGYRVELNAMSTDQLVEWIEGKLAEHGLATKVLPPKDVAHDSLEDMITSEIEAYIASNIKALIGDAADLAVQRLGRPELNGYYTEIAEHLKNCPPEGWQTLVQHKAASLVREHSKSRHDDIGKYLVERIQYNLQQNT